MGFNIHSLVRTFAPFARSLVLAAANALGAQSVAITLDDGPKLEATPLMSPEARNAAIIRQLRAHQIPAMFFVTVARGADRPRGAALLKDLSDAGQLLGNHTVTHPDFNAAGTTLEAFEGEVAACDRVISTHAGYRRFLRFPYLREGASAKKRDGIRAYLRERGYRIGYVAIDTSDWLVDQKLCAKLVKDPLADLTRWRAFYLDHLWRNAQAYRALARRIYGRDLPLVLLLHHNLLNALFLGDVEDLFTANGWKLVSPDDAFLDPAYQVEPQVLPLDGSVLESTARALGIPLRPFFRDVKSEQRIAEETDQL